MNIVLAAVLILIVIFLACLGGALVGAGAGWVVGLFFDGSMALLAKALGVPEAAPYQIGAMFGFLGGFFRASVTSK